MQIGYRRQNVRPPFCQLGRKTHRQFLRQSEAIKIEVGRYPVGRSLTHKNGKRVTTDAQALLQRRQHRLISVQLAART